MLVTHITKIKIIHLCTNGNQAVLIFQLMNICPCTFINVPRRIKSDASRRSISLRNKDKFIKKKINY